MNAIPCPAHLSSASRTIATQRRVGILRAMADTFFVKADEMERFRRACAASNNLDGAAAWQRLANQTRTEAERFVFQADKMEGFVR